MSLAVSPTNPFLPRASSRKSKHPPRCVQPALTIVRLVPWLLPQASPQHLSGESADPIRIGVPSGGPERGISPKLSPVNKAGRGVPRRSGMLVTSPSPRHSSPPARCCPYVVIPNVVRNPSYAFAFSAFIPNAVKNLSAAFVLNAAIARAVGRTLRAPMSPCGQGIFLDELRGNPVEDGAEGRNRTSPRCSWEVIRLNSGADPRMGEPNHQVSAATPLHATRLRAY